MSKYYAIIRSTDHLAHYGIKGMKWGVRKAIDSGNSKKLDRQYHKAKKKLEKLNSRADVDVQRIAASKHKARAIAALGLATGGGVVPMILNNKRARAEVNAAKNAYGGFGHNYPGGVSSFSPRRKKIVGEGKGIYIHGNGLGTGPVGTADSIAGAHAALNGGGKAASTGSNPFVTRDRVAKAITAAGAGIAAYQTGKAIAAKRRTTAEGHAKAIAKRNEFRKEMNKAFAGTKYDSNNRKRRKSK